MEYTIDCPYCGEPVELLIDTTAGVEQQTVEDCSVCCQPIHLAIEISVDGEPVVTGRREDE